MFWWLKNSDRKLATFKRTYCLGRTFKLETNTRFITNEIKYFWYYRWNNKQIDINLSKIRHKQSKACYVFHVDVDCVCLNSARGSLDASCDVTSKWLQVVVTIIELDFICYRYTVHVNEVKSRNFFNLFDFFVKP